MLDVTDRLELERTIGPRAPGLIHSQANALETLEQIDPASSCYNEVEKLITEISQKVDRKEKQEFDLEKERINAVKEIGKAYYSNTIKLVQYNIIVK